MKVLHVMGSLDPMGGGPPMSCGQLAGAQAALGHDVSLLTHAAAPDRVEPVEAVIARLPGMDRVRRFTAPGLSGLARLMLPALPSPLAQQVREADIIHLHGVWEPLLRQVARAAQAAGRPYAIAPRGMLGRWSLRQKRLKKQLALSLGYRAMLDHAAFVHALHPGEADDLAPVGVRAPIEIIPNGAHLPEAHQINAAANASGPSPVRGAWRGRHGLPSDDPIVLFLGRLHHQKGLDRLVDAWADLPDEVSRIGRLVIAGPDDGGEAALRGRIRRKLTASGRERIHLVGPQFGQDKASLLTEADVFVLPSRQEGFSVAVLEALAAGLPVILSEACHFPEAAAAGAGLVLRDGDETFAASLGRALEAILSDPERRARMGQAARLLAADYAWPSIARRTIVVYARYAGGDRGIGDGE